MWEVDERGTEESAAYLDSVNVRQSIACSVANEYNRVGEGHRRRNGSERRTLVQSTGSYHAHL